MDTSNSHQRREPKEGESSSTGARVLNTKVLEQRTYNLRPRKNYPGKNIPRERQMRREKMLREAEELIENAKRGMDVPYDQQINSEACKEGPVQKYRTEIMNADPSLFGKEWRPYYSTPDRGTSATLKGVSWEVEKLALQLARSVVGLQSLTGDTNHFSCSGTIVEFFENTGLVLTSANLVRCPDKDELADDLKINVYLTNCAVLEGHLLNHDFYHNICLIQICSPVHLPKKSFSSNTEVTSFDKSYPRDVVALGRNSTSFILMVSLGKVISKRSKFDCEELIVSTCMISKRGVGGPLMDFAGNIVGMNFYDNKETPFIPSFIVLKCLQQFKRFGEVVRPWHGLRVRTLYTKELKALEKMCISFHGVNGVIVEKIEEQSAKASGIKEGDVINRIDGIYFSNAAELGGILLDKGTNHRLQSKNLDQLGDSNLMPIMLKFGVRGSEGERTINVDKFTSGGINRWPFPKPIIVRQYFEGELVREEWRTADY